MTEKDISKSLIQIRDSRGSSIWVHKDKFIELIYNIRNDDYDSIIRNKVYRVDNLKMFMIIKNKNMKSIILKDREEENRIRLDLGRFLYECEKVDSSHGLVRNMMDIPDAWRKEGENVIAGDIELRREDVIDAIKRLSGGEERVEVDSTEAVIIKKKSKCEECGDRTDIICVSKGLLTVLWFGSF
jgi:hypothetical protein